MFTLLRMLSVRRLLIEQLPSIAAAWLIAELFYKFRCRPRVRTSTAT